MFVVMGGTGHVGAACAGALLARGAAVTVVTRDARHAAALAARGAAVAEADATDVDALRAVFARGRRAFLLNPPADVADDTDVAERRTVATILAALDGSGLEKVVAASVLGARRGRRVGDLSVLWELEEGLRRQSIPAAINRGAYYMSNYAPLVETARRTGELPSMLPADLVLPMVAPRDLGEAAARRLLSPLDDVGIRDVEGPARRSPADVATILSQLLDRPVTVTATPRENWVDAFIRLGFSVAAADAYARMTAVSVDETVALREDAIIGETTLEDYLASVVTAG